MWVTDRYLVLISGGLFLLFFTNVVVGTLGFKVFLTDVQEMLTLFAACIFFVAVILFRERKAGAKNENSGNSEHRETNQS